MAIVKIKQLKNTDRLEIPYYTTKQSTSLDLPAAIDNDVIIKAGETKIIPTGIAIALPSGCEAQIRPRSGLAAEHSVTVLNSPGTIDTDYRGEVKVILINYSKKNFAITRGTLIAQMVVAKYEYVKFDEVQSLEETEHGKGGFGSTGK